MPRTPALVALSALAALAVALPAVAQSRGTPGERAAPAVIEARGARMIDVPAGTTVIVLPAGAMPLAARNAAMPTDFVPVAAPVPPAFGMIRQMMSEMDALMALPMPDPQQLIEAAMHQGIAPGFAGGPILARDGALPVAGSVLVTTISTPAGTCEQTIRTGAAGPDGRPVTQVSRSGGACDALMPMPAGMTETTPQGAVTPAPLPASPAPALRRPDQPRLWTVSTDPQPIAPQAHPRT